MLRSLFVTCAILTGVFSFPTSNHVLHEKRDIPLRTPRQALDPDSIIPIRIALRQKNLEHGHRLLMDIAHPTSERYGQHLSKDEVHDIFAPAEETLNVVKDWLLSSGLNADDILHYENRGWLAIDMPARHAESLLSTKYYEYEVSGRSRIGCDAYSLPAQVSEHVDFIKPGIKMSPPLKKRVVKRGEAGWPHGGPGWPRPPHFPAHHWPHWHPPPPAYGLPPDLRECGVNIT